MNPLELVGWLIVCSGVVAMLAARPMVWLAGAAAGSGPQEGRGAFSAEVLVGMGRALGVVVAILGGVTLLAG